jgi:hypothetical protein
LNRLDTLERTPCFTFYFLGVSQSLLLGLLPFVTLRWVLPSPFDVSHLHPWQLRSSSKSLTKQKPLSP